MIYENLLDDSMNSSVALMIALFDSIGNLSSPYKIIERNSFLKGYKFPQILKERKSILNENLFMCAQITHCLRLKGPCVITVGSSKQASSLKAVHQKCYTFQEQLVCCMLAPQADICLVRDF